MIVSTSYRVCTMKNIDFTDFFNVFLSGATIRGAAYQYYNVKEYGNGCIILEPRELAVPESISARTLADMDRAVSNFKRGEVSPIIDLSDF